METGGSGTEGTPAGPSPRSRPQDVPGSLLRFTQDKSALGTRLREEPTHRGALAAQPPGP